jgi:hypothetical protein
VRPDGAKHNWSLSYDPAGAGGNGAIEFTLDGGPPITGELLPGHELDGARFNRFGMFNAQIPGGPMTIYFDDLTYTSRHTPVSGTRNRKAGAPHPRTCNKTPQGPERFPTDSEACSAPPPRPAGHGPARGGGQVPAPPGPPRP